MAFTLVVRHRGRFLVLALPGSLLNSGTYVLLSVWAGAVGTTTGGSKAASIDLASGAAALGIGVGYFLALLVTDLLVVPAAFDAMLGRKPSVKAALSLFVRVLPGAVVAMILISVISAVLFLSLVGIPVALFLLVRWSFLVQELVREPGTSLTALGRSARLVQGSWWRCFGVNLAIVLLGLLPGLVIQPVVRNVHNDAVVVVLVGLAAWLAGPFMATARSVLYADVKLRKGERLQDRAAAGE